MWKEFLDPLQQHNADILGKNTRKWFGFHFAQLAYVGRATECPMKTAQQARYGIPVSDIIPLGVSDKAPVG